MRENNLSDLWIFERNHHQHKTGTTTTKKEPALVRTEYFLVDLPDFQGRFTTVETK